MFKRSISYKQCFEKVFKRLNTAGEGAVNALLIRSFIVRELRLSYENTCYGEGNGAARPCGIYI